MAQLNFGGTVENVVIRDEFPLEKAREVLKNETIAVIGYGVQGPGQALNLRDNRLQRLFHFSILHELFPMEIHHG